MNYSGELPEITEVDITPALKNNKITVADELVIKAIKKAKKESKILQKL